MLKKPPTSRRMLFDWREREKEPGGGFFSIICGVVQEEMGIFPFSGQWKRKEKQVAGRSGKINERKRAGWLGLAPSVLGHQTPGSVLGTVELVVPAQAPWDEGEFAEFLQPCLSSSTSAIQTLCLAREGSTNTPQTAPDMAMLP